MKKLIFLLTMLITTSGFSQLQFNQDQEFKLTGFVDPTFQDAGFQFGAGIRKEMLWGWAGAELSVYPQLTPYYADLVGQGGVIMNWGAFDILGGIRIGAIARGDGYFPHALIGALIQVDYKLWFAENVTVGIRLWPDYRTDQDDQFLGDSDGHTYILFKDPKVQENGAFVFTILLN